MIRELANYSPPNYAAVFRWPIREALIAYHEKVRAAALVDFRHELAVWSAIAPHSGKRSDPPKVPAILRARQAD